MEVTITTENFESYKNGELPLVVDLWATWCGPCRQIAPIMSELAEEFDGKLVVGKCDVEENDDIAMEFGVRNIPTILSSRAVSWLTSLLVLLTSQLSRRSLRRCCKTCVSFDKIRKREMKNGLVSIFISLLYFFS